MEKIQDFGCNNATTPVGGGFTGNIIPNDWYKKITTNSGRPDLSAIAILAEIVYWYRPGRSGEKKFQSDAWQTSYEYFENKFGYNRQKIRRTFVRLEELGFIKRELRIIKNYGQKYGNVLFIHLSDLSLLGQKTNGKKISIKEVKNDKPLLQNCSDYIDIENKKENNRSNFSNLKKKESIPKKTLKDFYPLSEADLDILQKESSRNFDLNAANEILSSMARKLPSHEFGNKKAFMHYMSKALASELRQAERINNPSFQIRSNKSDDQIELHQKEKYLDEIENFKNTDPDILLKRKLVGLLPISTAYDVIRSMDILVDQRKISFRKKLKLSMFEKEIISREATFLMGDICVDFSDLEIISTKEPKKSLNFWNEVREKAKSTLGDDIDRAWFARINPEIDLTTKRVKLRAETAFIRDWVDNHYKKFLTIMLSNCGYRLEEIY